MNVLKVGLTAPKSTVASPTPIPGEAEGKWGGEPSALKSAVGRVIGGIHRSRETAAKGAQQTAPVDPATRGREVQEVVEKVNETLETFGTTTLRFSYDHERQLVVMQVVRAADGLRHREEVIRQIPPEDLLERVEKLEELQGVLFDGQA